MESNHKKVEKQAKRQQERAKNRSETNKTPTQNEQKRRPKNQSELRPRSELRTQSLEQKKEGCENPSKNIRVVLWNETHRVEKPNPIVLRIIFASRYAAA